MYVTTVNQSLLFQRDVVEIIGFNTNGQFQTTDRRKAKSKMGEEEANQDLTGKRKKKEESSEVSSDTLCLFPAAMPRSFSRTWSLFCALGPHFSFPLWPFFLSNLAGGVVLVLLGGVPFSCTGILFCPCLAAIGRRSWFAGPEIALPAVDTGGCLLL